MRTRFLSGIFGGFLGFGTCGLAYAGLPPRAPGLWQSTTTVTGQDGQALPNASDMVTLSCVDPATDTRFFTSNARACSKLSISGKGLDFSIDGACTQPGKSVNIHETLHYASARQVTLIAVLDTATGKIKVMSTLQWQGACPVGMKPGDEGSMVNGAFAKAGNIDDSGDL